MTAVRLACLVLAWQLLGATPCLADAPLAGKFVHAADALENGGVGFDSSYRRIAYPLGDVPANVGVCADVVVRAYRAIGIDLQRLVHEDMERSFFVYPKRWGLSRPDANIDHRRVLNLRVFFARHGKVLKITDDPKDYKPGDLVTWNLVTRGSLPHIGIVTDRRTADGARPLMMHNAGGGQVFQDLLFLFKITGHYRYAID
ncbi:MAG TPA: DUF1287 domain-containing protein [Rhizomicrobium sp.]